MFTKVGCAIVSSGTKEFCFVRLGWCSLNQSILYDSHYYHKQSIFHEEKHLQEIGGKDIIRRNELGSGNFNKKMNTEYLQLL
jgi:hypothetical protein